MMTDNDKQTVWKAKYSPFGEISIETQTVALQLRLPGQYEDNETGTYYNYLRDYDPKTGRYVTSDPLGTQAGLNTYAYVKNDPLNRVDPLGLYDELVHYYMTYFLAAVAGVPKEQALEIALATQFIDDNSRTAPLSPTGVANGAWSKYHFTLDYNNGSGGDSSPQRVGESDEEYLKRRFVNPSSIQLTNLYNASEIYNIDACILSTGRSAQHTRNQLYGEYLHAFEDTFAHRNRDNSPLPIFNTSGLLGHGALGTKPDHTYNQSKQHWITRFDKPLPGGGFAKESIFQ